MAKAKKVIADYKRAIGDDQGMAELMVFYCEQASGFASEVGLDDEGFYDALVRRYGKGASPEAATGRITLSAREPAKAYPA